MKWFKHDTDASIDAKLQELLLDYGASGYGLYWYCVELIAKRVTPKNITFELEHDARLIARNLNLTQQETVDMMKKMVELGLFDLSTNEKLRCVKLAYRLDDSLRKSVNTDSIVKKFKENNEQVEIIPTNPEKVHSEEKRREVDKDREENKNRDSIAEIINHLNQVTKSNYKPTTPKTKTLIQTRLNEGFTIDDFKQVHIIKYSEWAGTDFEKFLRPETLYGNKFESYLNQKTTNYEKMKAINSHTGLSALEMLQQQGYA